MAISCSETRFKTFSICYLSLFIKHVFYKMQMCNGNQISVGEHKQWCKRTNYEESVRVPALVHVPGLTDNGIVTDKLTEVVDLFPTVVEAAGLQPGKPK